MGEKNWHVWKIRIAAAAWLIFYNRVSFIFFGCLGYLNDRVALRTLFGTAFPEGQIFAYFRSFIFFTRRWFSQQLKILYSVGFWCVFLQFSQVFLFCCEKKRIFDQISVFWRSNFCIFQIFYSLTSRWFYPQLKILYSVGFWCAFLQFCQVFLFCCEKKPYLLSDYCILKTKFLHFSALLFSYKQIVFPAIKAPLLRRILMRIFAVLPGFFILLWKKNVFLIRFLYFEGHIFAYFRSFIFLQADGSPSN